EKHDAPIDIHCDEIDDPQSRFVDVIAAQTRARGLRGRVTVSHAVAMAYYAPGYLARLLPKLVEADLGFAIAPNENLQLQGRGFGPPTPRGVAPVRDLVEWGLPVAFCQDSMEDPWYPLGAGDPVRNLDAGLHVAHMLTAEHIDAALDFITTNPARNLGLEDYGITEGAHADLLVLDAQSDREVLREHPDVLLSLHRGVEVFRQEPRRRTWSSIARTTHVEERTELRPAARTTPRRIPRPDRVASPLRRRRTPARSRSTWPRPQSTRVWRRASRSPQSAATTA